MIAGRTPRAYASGLRRLFTERRGVAAVEFAVVAPLFLLASMGIFDLSYQYYVKATLAGIMENAGRAATLQDYSADQSTLDAAVRDQIHRTYNGVDIQLERKAYASFGNVKAPERFTDTNGNGSFDGGECFQDTNANGAWDADPGTNGNGGANQVVLYTAKVSFVRLFPLWIMLGQPQTKLIEANTLLRNQPYGDSASAPQSIC